MLCIAPPDQLRQCAPAGEVVDNLIRTYREEAEHYLTLIEQGSVRGDWEQVSAAAHALRSASATVGAEQVASLCLQIEDAAQLAVEQELQVLLKRLRLTVTATLVALDDYRQVLYFPLN